MARRSGRVLCPISRVQAYGLPGETITGPGPVHRGPMVPPIRQDPLRSSPPTLVMSPKPRFNVLVLAPAVRQSKIIIRKITNFLPKLPKYIALKPLKTKIEFYNGSRIQAFPNSPETIRGEPGVNLLYCLPPQTPILRPHGKYTPVCQLKVGECVVTFNTFTGVWEIKRILTVVRNSLAGRKIVRINHDTGSLECTAEHRVFTWNRGYVPASQLISTDQLLTYWKVQASTLKNLQLSSGTSHPWRSFVRLLPMEEERSNERDPHRESFLQASLVRS